MPLYENNLPGTPELITAIKSSPNPTEHAIEVVLGLHFELTRLPSCDNLMMIVRIIAQQLKWQEIAAATGQSVTLFRQSFSILIPAAVRSTPVEAWETIWPPETATSGIKLLEQAARSQPKQGDGNDTDQQKHHNRGSDGNNRVSGPRGTDLNDQYSWRN